MRATVFKVMVLGLLRDRGALAMSFILPGAVFVIFALIFAGAAGGDLTLRLAIANERGDDVSNRFVAGLMKAAKIQLIGENTQDAALVRAQVRNGAADVGLVVRATGRPLSDLGDGAPSPFEIVGDPGRQISISILQGALQKAYFSAVPDVAMKGIADIVDKRFVTFSPEQKIRLDQGLKALRDQGAQDKPAGFRIDRLFEQRDAIAKTEAAINVTYYAGAVAIMFLLFSALNGAMSYLEEDESGLLNRLATGPGGVHVLLHGKFVFLVIQGFVQVALIYVIAWLGFRVDLLGHLGPWAITTLMAAVAAGGLALLFVVSCRSKQQAQALGNILILVISALGGSMVPRFLMPVQIQQFGWITPNTWALEAYSGIFWRSAAIEDLYVPWATLGLAGLIALGVASGIARRQR